MDIYKIGKRYFHPIKILVNWALLFIFFIGGQSCNGQNKIDGSGLQYISNNGLKVEVNPETFSIAAITKKGKRYIISNSIKKEIFSELAHDTTKISWKFPQKGITVNLELAKSFLDVNIKTDSASTFTWPIVDSKVDAYTIPLHQGKYIPARDAHWIKHMSSNSPFSGSQDLSMQFFATNNNDKALLYVIKNMFNNQLEFYDNKKTLALKFNHEFPSTVKDKQYGFRIYLTDNDPVAIAKKYKQYIEETSKIITLEEKAKDNPNIKKLYGAPHIYIWNSDFITSGDISKWKLFKDKIIKELNAVTENPTRHIFNLFKAKGAESGKEFLNELNKFRKEEFVIRYHKNLLARALSEVLVRKDFYDPEAWKNTRLSNDALSLINKGVNNLAAVDLYHLNKLLFVVAYPDVTISMQDWGGAPLSVLDEMQVAGIEKAWLGLNDWTAGEMHPEFVAKAKADGYLIGPYDSYHSMHQPGKERWLTAKFDDTSLYTKAFVMNKNGKPADGFLGEGRKLNPVLSMPAVKYRMEKVMENSDKEFNSWFIDCDATGECLDDYTQGRMTSQEDDTKARLKRMAWIRDTYKLVIGSEVGNDFAASTIAFGHGMTTPIIEWGDPDMRKNKESKYYIGGYFSNDGGIPARYDMPVILKDKYLYTYFDSRFNVPLFQLVYNNSVITSHHWEWNSLKVPAEIKITALKEILYNVPPLYHLDGEAWSKYKDIIAKQVKVFLKTHELAIKLEMTDFTWLTEDHLVQRTKFGNSLEIVANFGAQSFKWNDRIIYGLTLLIHDLITNEYKIYNP